MKVTVPSRRRVKTKVLMRKRQAAISGRGEACASTLYNVDFCPLRTCVTEAGGPEAAPNLLPVDRAAAALHNFPIPGPGNSR